MMKMMNLKQIFVFQKYNLYLFYFILFSFFYLFKKKINKIKAFEGEKGDKLMKLQLKYGTDSRFKLDDRFKDDFDEDEEEEEESKKSSTLQDPNLDNLKKELEVDKGSALKVLGSLFPDKKYFFFFLNFSLFETSFF